MSSRICTDMGHGFIGSMIPGTYRGESRDDAVLWAEDVTALWGNEGLDVVSRLFLVSSV